MTKKRCMDHFDAINEKGQSIHHRHTDADTHILHTHCLRAARRCCCSFASRFWFIIQSPKACLVPMSLRRTSLWAQSSPPLPPPQCIKSPTHYQSLSSSIGMQQWKKKKQKRTGKSKEMVKKACTPAVTRVLLTCTHTTQHTHILPLPPLALPTLQQSFSSLLCFHFSIPFPSLLSLLDLLNNHRRTEHRCSWCQCTLSRYTDTSLELQDKSARIVLGVR